MLSACKIGDCSYIAKYVLLNFIQASGLHQQLSFAKMAEAWVAVNVELQKATADNIKEVLLFLLYMDTICYELSQLKGKYISHYSYPGYRASHIHFQVGKKAKGRV